MKRLFCAFLTLCLLVGLLPGIPITAKAEKTSTADTTALWTDFAADSYAGGNGSNEKYPLQIATAEELARLAVQVNSGNSYSNWHFELIADIDLSGYLWVPIGEQYDTPFLGDFDGNGYTISGLTMNNSSVFYDSCGLFGYAQGGLIHNLNLTNVSIELSDHPAATYIGSVVGYGDCFNYIDVSGSIRVVNSAGSELINCGGIIGYSLDAVINSSFTGSISVSAPAHISAGGIHGYVNNSKTTFHSQNCRATGSITVESTYKGDTVFDSYADVHVGGITGYNRQGCTNCYSTMDISVKSVNAVAGGLIGMATGKIKDCYATGAVSLATAYYSDIEPISAAGGLVGQWWGGSIENCYTQNPSVSSTMSNAQTQTYAGKLVGYDVTDSGFKATNSYVSASTTLKRNGFQDGGDCDADSYPVVNSAHSTYSMAETDTFTYSDSFISDTLGWSLYSDYSGDMGSMAWNRFSWILGGENPILFIDYIHSLTIRYWDPSDTIFDISLTHHNPGSKYSVTSPESNGNTPDQAVVSGTIYEDTYLDVHYTHEHLPGSEATCTSSQICTNCKAVLVPQLPHDYAVTDVVVPNCTENGYTIRTCQSCALVTNDTYVSPLGHELDQSNICIRCGLTFEAPLRDYRVHVLDSENGQPLSGVSVKLGSVTILTDAQGIAAHQISASEPMVLSVRAEGYQNHYQADFTPGDLPDTYVFLLCGDTGIYLAQCNNKNVLQSTAQINALSPTLEASITVKGRSKAKITRYELVQGSAVIATSTDGVFKVKNPHFRQGEPVYARMYTDAVEGCNVFSQKLNINVVGFSFDANTDWGKLLPFSAGMDLSFPGGTPVLEGLNFKIPAYAIGKNGYVKVQLGNEKLMITFGDKNDVNEKEEDLDNKSKTQLLKKMRDDWVKRNNPNAWPEGNKENEVEASFGMVIEFSGTQVTSVYGQANVAYNLSYENGKTFMVWFIPIYAEISTSFGGQIQVSNIGYDFENTQVLVPNFRLSLNGQITLREGIGCSVISAGVYGTAGASLIFGAQDLQEYVSYRIYGELGLYARLKLFFWKAMEYRLPLLQGEFSGGAGNYARRAMYSLEGYETVSRDYLRNRSPWLSKVPRNGAVPKNTTLQTSSYTAIDPQLVICGDTVMMVFADDDGTDGLNYQHLYYSLYQPDTGLWSQPRRVDNNDLCDLEYEVCTDGSKIWIVYTQMEAVTEENQDAYEALLSTVEVNTAVYDPKNDCFINHTTLTDNASFETLPQLAATKEGIRAAWISNSTNDAFSQNANNQLFTALYSGSSWSKPLALTPPCATTVSMDLGLLQDTAYVATVIDVDCDLSTNEDRQVVLTDMNGAITAVNTQKNTNESVQFGMLNGTQSLLWYQDCNLYNISTPVGVPKALFEQAVEGLDTDYRLVTLSRNQQALIYTAAQRWTDDQGVEQSGSNLQVIFQENGKWGQPIPLTAAEANRYVENYDVQVLNGKLLLPYISMNASVSSTDIQRTADFRCSYTSIPRDLVVGEAIYLPSTMLENETLELKVPITNNSTVPVEHVTYQITDSEGNLVKEGSPYLSIASGHEGWLNALIPRSALTPGRQYAVTVTAYQNPDDDLSNNTVDLNLWYGDLSVAVDQLLLGKQQIQYGVSNDGNAAAEGILELLLVEEDGSETLLHSTSIVSLAPGKSIFGTLPVDENLCNANRIIRARITPTSQDLYDFNNEAGLALQALVREEITEVPEPESITLSPEFSTPHIIHNQRYGGSKTITVTENGWTLASIKGVTSAGYSYSNGTLVLQNDWLQGLKTGNRTITLGYKKGTQTTKINLILEITDTTPQAAFIAAADQVFQINGNPPLLGTDVLYETNSLGTVTASYSLNGNGIWQKGLPSEVGTYKIYLYVAEDTQNNLAEGNCYFTLEVIKGNRAISQPQVTALADGSYRFNGAVPTAGASDGTISYGYSTVNDASTVAHWSDTGLLPAPEASATYYLFARITDGANFEDAYSLGLPLDIHIHTYEVTITDPTCLTIGFTTHTCTVCQESYIDTQIPALGHSFTGYVPDHNATCTENGTQTAVCDRCDAVNIQVLEGTATGHSFDEGVITADPSCTQEGQQIFSCHCGEQYSTVLPATGHRYEAFPTPPTCEDAGFTAHICSLCGDRYTDSTVAPTGHSYDAGVITAKPSCTKDGVMTFTCGCGHQYTTVLPATGHEYVPAGTIPPQCELPGASAIGCIHCGDVETTDIPPTGHSYTDTVTPPTCLEAGYITNVCDNCGKTEILPGAEPLGHSFTNYHSDGNATCTEDGSQTAHCDRCDAVDTVVDPGSSYGHLYDGGTVIMAPDCIRNGTIMYRCENCDDQYEDVIFATGHLYEVTVTTPSCEQTGYTTHCCTVCGDTFTDGVTAATGHSYAEGFCLNCGILQPGYAIYSGYVQSYGDAYEPITLELIPDGSSTAAYTIVLEHYAESYCFRGIPAGNYTLAIHKKNHVSRYFTISVSSGDSVAVQPREICLLGDITGEGKVNVGDVARLYGHIRKTSTITDEYAISCADVTGDGRLNVGDTATLYSHVKNTKKLY